MVTSWLEQEALIVGRPAGVTSHFRHGKLDVVVCSNTADALLLSGLLSLSHAGPVANYS